MNPTVRALLAAQGGVVSTSQLLAAGVSRFQLRRLVQTRQLIRLRRGILVDPAVWRAAAPWQKHVIRARGLMLGPAGADDSPVALSHHSALSLMSVGLYGVDERVHIVRTDGRRSQTDTFVQCHAPVDAGLIRRIVTTPDGSPGVESSRAQVRSGSSARARAVSKAQGPSVSSAQERSVRVVAPALAILQVAATFGVEAGLVSADSALREKLVTVEELTETLTARPLGNGSPHARTMVEHVNGLSESAGETRCRWLFDVLGLPTPELQAVIRDRSGQFVGRVDFLFADARTIVEFDGLIKYTDRESLVAEKAREDALRALGFSVVRITWEDLAHPQRVLGKVLRGFQSATSAA